MYQYTYIDKFDKRQYLYTNDLVTLCQKEELLRDRFDVIDSQT